jgi:hypothetical protein
MSSAEMSSGLAVMTSTTTGFFAAAATCRHGR